MLEMRMGMHQYEKMSCGPIPKYLLKNVQEQDEEEETPIVSHFAKEEMIFVYKRIHVGMEMSSFN
jgi:hypothetical protein